MYIVPLLTLEKNIWSFFLNTLPFAGISFPGCYVQGWSEMKCETLAAKAQAAPPPPCAPDQDYQFEGGTRELRG